MPKDKAGNQLTWKEFGERWKKGIEGITPLQQTRTSINSTWIMLVGIVAGLIITLIAIKTLWWLSIILTGALFNTVVVQIGNYQKYFILKRLEGGIEK
jgi:membrane glycosyltransferase|tara:strand:- start:4779 stop:5072 length:294 start_codon:yes stop_codon:yes gene_type:complete